MCDLTQHELSADLPPSPKRVELDRNQGSLFILKSSNYMIIFVASQIHYGQQNLYAAIGNTVVSDFKIDDPTFNLVWILQSEIGDWSLVSFSWYVLVSHIQFLLVCNYILHTKPWIIIYNFQPFQASFSFLLLREEVLINAVIYSIDHSV